MSEPASPNEPAIVLNENETQPLKLQTILAATDLSANSLVATQYACNLAKLTQGTVPFRSTGLYCGAESTSVLYCPKVQ
ncbi:MAG: hypothetical protein WB586_22535 [Chthoniobacterales bacterium]